ALRVLTELRPYEIRQAIEPLAHVDRLGAHEDANTRRDHGASRIERSRRTATASKSQGSRSFATLRSSSSKPLCATGVGRTSTKLTALFLLRAVASTLASRPRRAFGSARFGASALCSRASIHLQ